MNELTDLPNIEGFRFIGVTKLGNRMACVVSHDQVTDCGTGEPVHGNLVGWLPSPIPPHGG